MKKIISTIVFMLVTMVVNGQKVTFYSPEFEDGVRDHIGLAEGADVLQTHTDTITVINLSGLGITDIRDVVYLSAVKELNLSYNKISDVSPLLALEELQSVNLSNNQIEDVNILAFMQQESLELDVSGNYIQDFSYFYTPTPCEFIFLGMGMQQIKDVPYFDVYQLHADINTDGQPVVSYRGYTNMDAASYLKCGSSNVSAQLDGNTYQVTITENAAETSQVTLSNGEESEETYIVPSADYQVEAGQTVTLETWLPDDYILYSTNATAGTVEIVGNTLLYTATNDAAPDIIYFSYYQGSVLKGFSRFYINRETIETEPVKIGSKGKATYCGDKSLDFSFSDEIKAYVATGFDKDEGTIWLTRVKDVPAGVPVLIKGEANKTYDVPVTDSQNSYYTNMFVGNTSGASIEIYETSADGSKVNYYLKDGTFLSVTGNAKIGKNKCYLQLPATFNASVTGTSQTVTVGSTGKASFAASVDLDFTNVDGLKAFTATGYDKSTKTIWLTRVMKVQQGEGVLLKGDPDNYEIPSVAAQSHYENMFVGNTSGASIEIYETSADGSQTNYYLKGGTFLSVTGNAKIGNNKCYLALPTSMVATGASTRGSEKSYKFEEPEMIKLPISFRSLENDGDGTTGIKVQSSMSHVPSDAYYTLQGQRVVNPGKGLYIKNGKKVIVK